MSLCHQRALSGRRKGRNASRSTPSPQRDVLNVLEQAASGRLTDVAVAVRVVFDDGEDPSELGGCARLLEVHQMMRELSEVHVAQVCVVPRLADALPPGFA